MTSKAQTKFIHPLGHTTAKDKNMFTQAHIFITKTSSYAESTPYTANTFIFARQEVK
jgi:hypothetical protein